MELINTGLIYRNPKPHVRSRHAYFPSVVNLGEDELLCSFLMGEAFESADGRLFLARSQDGGATWRLEGRMLPERSSGPYSETCRIARLADGSLAANVFIFDRHRTDEGMANPATLGFVETELALFRSTDSGRTWLGPEPVNPPIVGPAFEACSPIVELHDGRWLFPTSTWKAWDGSNPTGMKAVALVSEDAGRTWPEYVDVLDGVDEGIIYFESKVVELRPGFLVSVGWAFREAACADLPNAYSISTDGGRSFGPARTTGLNGQTAAIHRLDDNRLLCVYRRVDEPGLWAADVSIGDGTWRTEHQIALWDAAGLLIGECARNRVKEFNVLRFGAPCLVDLDAAHVLVAFWCVEDSVSNIRWLKLRISK